MPPEPLALVGTSRVVPTEEVVIRRARPGQVCHAETRPKRRVCTWRWGVGRGPELMVYMLADAPTAQPQEAGITLLSRQAVPPVIGQHDNGLHHPVD